MVGRIPVVDVGPLVADGRLPTKASVGEPFDVTATVFREGHDELGCDVVLTDPSGVRRPPVRMHKLDAGVDRYAAAVVADVEGAWAFEVQSWSDPLATWLHHTEVKVPAGGRCRADVHRGRAADRPGAGRDDAEPRPPGPAAQTPRARWPTPRGRWRCASAWPWTRGWRSSSTTTRCVT